MLKFELQDSLTIKCKKMAKPKSNSKNNYHAQENTNFEQISSNIVNIRNDLENDESVITLVHEGGNTYSLQTKQNNIEENLKIKENNLKQNDIIDKENPTEGNSFIRGEENVALSVQENGGGVRERLNKETTTGKSTTIIISFKNIF